MRDPAVTETLRPVTRMSSYRGGFQIYDLQQCGDLAALGLTNQPEPLALVNVQVEAYDGI